MIRRVFGLACGALAASLVLWAGAAQADPHGRGDYRGGPAHEHYDSRFSHGHYYPSRGYAVGALPRGYVTINHFHNRYFYSGGVWYAPRGPSFVVVAPPFGAFVPMLPPFYTTVWFGGLPYYYANDTYYVWRESSQGYEVVTPPDGSGDTATTQLPPSEQLYIYPKNGQSEDQQSRDRYECHSWASGQSGFDPTKSGGGVDPQDASSKRGEYNRAMTACLEGRGYSVK